MIPVAVCGLIFLARITPSLAVWGMMEEEYLSGNEHYGALVHLMEWPYESIMHECNYLDWRGYFGIVISPPIEHVVDKDGSSWKERYKPISTTNMMTRSGSKEQLSKMVDECWGRQRMRFIVDLNLNNMLLATDSDATGFGYSRARPNKFEYPDGIGRSHFHNACPLTPQLLKSDSKKVRECQVEGMQDLDNKNEDLQKKHRTMMNELIDMGVAGFRIVLARHMYPDDLSKLYLNLNKMKNGQTPVAIHDINDMDTCVVKAKEYERAGMTTDYEYGHFVAQYFLKENKDLRKMLTWDGVKVNDALKARDKERLVFLYNHLTPAAMRDKLMKTENQKAFGMAMAFMMAFPYGIPMVMSSYKGNVAPLESQRMVKSPRPAKVPSDQFQYDCEKEYNCEHRDELTNKMALFKADVKEKKLSMLESDVKDHWFAFEREERGFIFFNAGTKDITKTFNGLKMRAGEYCDVATGELIEVRSKCSGKIITIDDEGSATITLEAKDPNGYVAIHRDSWLDPWKKAIANALNKNEHAKYMFGFAGRALDSIMRKGLDTVERLQETYKDPNAKARDYLVAGVGETGATLVDAAGSVAVAAAKGAGNMAKQRLEAAAAGRAREGSSEESSDVVEKPEAGSKGQTKTPKGSQAQGKTSGGEQKGSGSVSPGKGGRKAS